MIVNPEHDDLILAAYHRKVGPPHCASCGQLLNGPLLWRTGTPGGRAILLDPDCALRVGVGLLLDLAALHLRHGWQPDPVGTAVIDDAMTHLASVLVARERTDRQGGADP